MQGRSYYPPGSSNTDVSGGPAPSLDPAAALQALIAREGQMMSQPRRMMAPAAPVGGGGPAYTSGTGPRTREGVRGGMTPGEAAQALAGRHSFVTNIKGGPQVMGGLVSSGSGPGAVYGGWQVDEAPGPVRFANLPSDDRAYPQEPVEDPADRAMRINAALPRARFMPLAGR